MQWIFYSPLKLKSLFRVLRPAEHAENGREGVGCTGRGWPTSILSNKRAFAGNHLPVLMYESYGDYCILANEPLQVSIRLCWCMSHMLADVWVIRWVIRWLPRSSKRIFSGEHPSPLMHESYAVLMYEPCVAYRILSSFSGEPFQVNIRLRWCMNHLSCWCMSHTLITAS